MLLYTSLSMVTIALCLSSSPMPAFLWLIITILSFSITMAVNMTTIWPPILMFLGLIGGLMILFSFIVSSSNKISKSVNLQSLPMLIVILPIMTNSYTSMMKTEPMIYTMNFSSIIVLIITLNISLTLMSKILVNPISPMKSSTY